MKTKCEGCNTIYDLSSELEGKTTCPVCEHINAPRSPIPTSSPAPMAHQSFDTGKTMVAPIEGEWGKETSVVQNAISGKTPVLPENQNFFMTIIEGEKRGQRIPLTKSAMTLGRKDTDIILPDSEISRRHCTLVVFDHLIVIRDNGSANGTMINGTVINEGLLKNGDELQVGMTVLKLSVEPKS